MNHKDYTKQIAEAIVEMVREKQFTYPQSQSDFMRQMVESVQQKQYNEAFNTSITDAFIKSMLEKIETEKTEKLNLYDATLEKTTNSICKLFQEIDQYVLAETVDENMKEINVILDELIPELEKRDTIIELIKELRENRN